MVVERLRKCEALYLLFGINEINIGCLGSVAMGQKKQEQYVKEPLARGRTCPWLCWFVCFVVLLHSKGANLALDAG